MGGKRARFVSFTEPGVGDLHWEHKRIEVAGALVLTWKGTGGTTQDFLPIGPYGPWEYRWEYMGQNIKKKDVEP